MNWQPIETAPRPTHDEDADILLSFGDGKAFAVGFYVHEGDDEDEPGWHDGWNVELLTPQPRFWAPFTP